MEVEKVLLFAITGIYSNTVTYKTAVFDYVFRTPLSDISVCAEATRMMLHCVIYILLARSQRHPSRDPCGEAGLVSRQELSMVSAADIPRFNGFIRGSSVTMLYCAEANCCHEFEV